MREEVYDYLRDYGFTKEDVNSFQDNNEKMFFTNLKEITKNIEFLVNKGLSKEEVMYVFKNNPFMITVKDKRLEGLDKIYIDELKMDVISLKRLIINNPLIYTMSPVELEKIINYLREHNCSNEMIKEFFIKHSNVVSMYFLEFKDIVEFV